MTRLDKCLISYYVIQLLFILPLMICHILQGSFVNGLMNVYIKTVQIDEVSLKYSYTEEYLQLLYFYI